MTMESNAALNTGAAEAYEKFLVPALNAPVAGKIVELAALQPGERVLDVACGTGVVAGLAAARVAPGGRIVGLDADPAMIAVARAVVRCPANVMIDWQCASAQEIPFESAAFDVAFCLQGLQYLPDCGAGLAEIRRVMRTRGRLVAAVWTKLEDCRGQLALARALERRDVDAASIRKAYSFGDPQRIRELATRSGFGDVEIRTGSSVARYASARAFVEAFAAGSFSSRAAISRVPEDRRSEFLDEIECELREYEAGNHVALPVGYLVLIAHS